MITLHHIKLCLNSQLILESLSIIDFELSRILPHNEINFAENMNELGGRSSPFELPDEGRALMDTSVAALRD